MNITATQLKALAPNNSTDRCQTLVENLNPVFVKYNINTPLRVAAYLAQLIHESAQFTAMSENLNYSVQGLMNTFSYYKTHQALATQQGRSSAHPADQQAIANTVYADVNRSPKSKLGNIQPGDGWLFRGAGFIQITGRSMFTTYAAYLKQDIKTVVGNVRSSDFWAVDSAAWVFAINKKLLDEADKGQIDAISRAINGGDNGLQERRDLYNQAMKILGTSVAKPIV